MDAFRQVTFVRQKCLFNPMPFLNRDMFYLSKCWKEDTFLNWNTSCMLKLLRFSKWKRRKSHLWFWSRSTKRPCEHLCVFHLTYCIYGKKHHYKRTPKNSKLTTEHEFSLWLSASSIPLSISSAEVKKRKSLAGFKHRLVVVSSLDWPSVHTNVSEEKISDTFTCSNSAG